MANRPLNLTPPRPPRAPGLPRAPRPISPEKLLPAPDFRPSNPSSIRRLTRAEQEYTENYHEQQAHQAMVADYQIASAEAEQERLDQRDRVRRQRQRENEALRRTGLTRGDVRGFFTDEEGVVHPIVNRSGFQYHRRRDDGSIAAVFYDEEAQTYLERDPLEAGTFELATSALEWRR